MAKTTSKSAAAPAFVKARAVDPNALNEVRVTCKRVRDLQKEIADTGDTLKEKQQELNDLERKTLPDLFNKAGVTTLGLEREGNMPAYIAERTPYYRANIAASWDVAKRQEAFEWLQKNGGADLVKTEIVITLPMKSVALRKIVLAALKKIKGLDYSVDLSVHSASLTKFIKECIERRKIKPPLDVLGADVGEIVRLKPEKAV